MSGIAAVDLTSPILATGDKMVVLRAQARKRHGSIILADSAVEKPGVGIVIETGPAVKDGRLRDNVLVLFGKYAGSPHEVDGREYLIMREDEIIGIVANKKMIEEIEVEGA